MVNDTSPKGYWEYPQSERWLIFTNAVRMRKVTALMQGGKLNVQRGTNGKIVIISIDGKTAEAK